MNAFEKIKEGLEDLEIYYDGGDFATCHDRLVVYREVLEIVNQVAEEYKHGHFGCNFNGQHEKCKDCGLRGECSHYNTEWFGSNSEIPNMSEKPTSSNEFCEWKCDALGFIINPHTKWMFNNEPRMKNVYCNTCGKKIIVAPYKPKGENNA